MTVHADFYNIKNCLENFEVSKSFKRLKVVIALMDTIWKSMTLLYTKPLHQWYNFDSSEADGSSIGLEQGQSLLGDGPVPHLPQPITNNFCCLSALTPFSRVSAASESFPSPRKLSTLFIRDLMPSPDWSASLSCTYKQFEYRKPKQHHYLLIIHFEILSKI